MEKCPQSRVNYTIRPRRWGLPAYLTGMSFVIVHDITRTEIGLRSLLTENTGEQFRDRDYAIIRTFDEERVTDPMFLHFKCAEWDKDWSDDKDMPKIIRNIMVRDLEGLNRVINNVPICFTVAELIKALSLKYGMNTDSLRLIWAGQPMNNG
jgi:hypothetical protein